MSAIERLHNRINLNNIPFTERGSRLLLFRKDSQLYIRLTERWEKWQQQFGHYRQRPPILDHFTFLDSDGNPLDFETDTYPHTIHLTTAAGRYDWVFLDTETLLVRLPAGRYGFAFECQSERAQTDRRGGAMRGKRNIAYTTNARILSNEMIPLENEQFRVRVQLEADDGMALLLNVTPRLGYNRSIPNPDEVIDRVRQSWEAWFDATPPVLDAYRTQYDYAWWVMRVGLLSTRFYFTREALVPSKIHYVGVWHWDQFFHAIAYRHIDTRLAEDQLRILIDHQQPNGMLPDAIHDEGLVTHLTLPVDADVTKPPLMAWTALKLYEKSGHLDFLYEIYEPLTRWNQWWVNENCNGDGLFEYHHPFSSGADDSPLWDFGMPVAAPDLNTYVYVQQQSIARIADLIGEHEAAAQFRADGQALVEKMLQKLWNPANGYFEALHDGEPIPVLTLFHLLPLWIDALPQDIHKRLVAHLTDPTTFWTKYPLSTVALTDTHFDNWQMWRGPTWPNVNYLFVEALAHVGERELASSLRRKTLELLMLHPDIYEYYHPVTGERPPKAAPIFGWSSAVFIELALQETQAAQAAE